MRLVRAPLYRTRRPTHPRRHGGPSPRNHLPPLSGAPDVVNSTSQTSPPPTGTSVTSSSRPIPTARGRGLRRFGGPSGAGPAEGRWITARGAQAERAGWRHLRRRAVTSSRRRARVSSVSGSWLMAGMSVTLVSLSMRPRGRGRWVARSDVRSSTIAIQDMSKASKASMSVACYGSRQNGVIVRRHTYEHVAHRGVDGAC